MSRHFKQPQDKDGKPILIQQRVVVDTTPEDVWKVGFSGTVIRIISTFKVTVSDLKGHAFDVPTHKTKVLEG